MGKNCLLAIFTHEFSAKTHLLFALTNDAPSLALLVLQVLGPAEPRKARKKNVSTSFWRGILVKKDHIDSGGKYVRRKEKVQR